MEKGICGEIGFRKFQPTEDVILYARGVLGQLMDKADADSFIIARLEKDHDVFNCRLEVHSKGRWIASEGVGATEIEAIDLMERQFQEQTSDRRSLLPEEKVDGFNIRIQNLRSKLRRVEGLVVRH